MKINFRILILTFCVLLSLGGCGNKSETTAPTAPTIVGSYYGTYTPQGSSQIYTVVQITQTNEQYSFNVCGVKNPSSFDKTTPCYYSKGTPNIPLEKVNETTYSVTLGGSSTLITAASDFSSIIIPFDPTSPLTLKRLTDEQANNVDLTVVPPPPST